LELYIPRTTLSTDDTNKGELYFMRFSKFFTKNELYENKNYILQGWKDTFVTYNDVDLTKEKIIFRARFTDHSSGINGNCFCTIQKYDSARGISYVRVIDEKSEAVVELKFIGDHSMIVMGDDQDQRSNYYINDSKIPLIQLDEKVFVRYPNPEAIKDAYRVCC